MKSGSLPQPRTANYYPGSPERLNLATSNNSAKRFLVSGRVQGVGYRFFVEREAARLGISGYAQNLDDGRVEVYAIGSRDDLGALLVALRKGPTFASVSAPFSDRVIPRTLWPA